MADPEVKRSKDWLGLWMGKRYVDTTAHFSSFVNALVKVSTHAVSWP